MVFRLYRPPQGEKDRSVDTQVRGGDEAPAHARDVAAQPRRQGHERADGRRACAAGSPTSAAANCAARLDVHIPANKCGCSTFSDQYYYM